MEKESFHNIGIDARHVGQTMDGLGRYVLEMINALEPTKNQKIIIFCNKEFPFELIKEKNNFLFQKINIKANNPLQHIILPYYIKKLKVHTYYYPFIDPPLFSPAKKNYFAIHDLNHFFFSEYAATNRKLAILLAKFFIYTASFRYDGIIVFSNYVKEQIKANIPFTNNKIHVIYHGFSNYSFKIKNRETNLNPIENLKPFLLYIGNNRPHKNLKRLLEAFKIIIKTKKDLKLVIAGNQIPRFFNIDEFIQKESIQANIKILSKVSDETLSELYKRAELIVYPSLSEGFGFPIIEAWYFKTPIITSQISCLPEIAQNGAAYFNPFEINDIAKNILNLIDNPAKKEELILNGNERFNLFKWKTSARHHLKLFMNS